jgi:hypothetical protein
VEETAAIEGPSITNRQTAPFRLCSWEAVQLYQSLNLLSEVTQSKAWPVYFFAFGEGVCKGIARVAQLLQINVSFPINNAAGPVDNLVSCYPYGGCPILITRRLGSSKSAKQTMTTKITYSTDDRPTLSRRN